MATAEHAHFVVISRMDQLRVYDAQTGRKSSEVNVPPGIVRFTGVAAADAGIYFASCQSAKGGEQLIARVRVSPDGECSELAIIDTAGGVSLGKITGNTISSSPDASRIIFAVSRARISAASRTATYSRFFPSSGILETVRSQWPGQISSLSWSGAGDKLAFMWQGEMPVRTGHLSQDSANAPSFGIRTCNASAADLPAASNLVARLSTGLGDLSCPVLSGSGMSVYAVAKTDSSAAGRLPPSVKLLRFPLETGEAEVVADDIEVAGTGEFVCLCRSSDDSALMLFERHRVSRLDLVTGSYTEIAGYERGPVIASAAW